MADVCHELHKLNRGRWWYDCLYSNPHKPNYLQKKNGTPAPIQMSVRAMYYGISEDKQRFIIDNVIASGVTASAAREAIPEGIVCAIAKA
jgi:adenine/guanine phosphoribosyltransferase-like PRPP-binding protein